MASRWGTFVCFCRSMSSDRLVMFFDEYVRDERERKKRERKEAKGNLDRLWPIRKQARRKEADDNEVKPLGPADGTAADPSSPREPSITETTQPKTLESLIPQPKIDGEQTNIPTPTSTLSSPSQDPQKTRQKSNCSLTEAKEDEYAQRKRPDNPDTSVDSRHQPGKEAIINTMEEEKGGSEQSTDSEPSRAVKKRRFSSNSEAGLRNYELLEARRTADQDGDAEDGDANSQQAALEQLAPVSGIDTAYNDT